MTLLKKYLNHWQHRWWARQRQIDIECLWPVLRTKANGDIEKARRAFEIHASGDHAWFALGETKAKRIIRNLPL